MKVLVKLRVYAGNANSDVVQAKNISLETQRTDTLHGVLRHAIQKARWNEKGLRTRSIRFYDRDFDDDVDVEEDERPVDLGKYEVQLERMPRVAIATASQSLHIAATSSGRLSPEVHQNGDTPVEFYVKGLAGRVLAFKLLTRPGVYDHRNVLTTDTVETLKEKIQHREGLPTSEQRLLIQGREMRNEQTLGEFPLVSGSKIEVTL